MKSMLLMSLFALGHTTNDTIVMNANRERAVTRKILAERIEATGKQLQNLEACMKSDSCPHDVIKQAVLLSSDSYVLRKALEGLNEE